MKNFGKLFAGLVIGSVVGASVVWKLKDKQKDTEDTNAQKYLTLFRYMNQYLVTKQRGKSIVDYFNDNGIKTVAIYGMSHIGQRIIDDLQGSNIKVLYGIDRRADRLTYEMDIYKPEDELPEVDAILVTAYDFDEIEEALSQKVDYQIIDFNDLIFRI